MRKMKNKNKKQYQEYIQNLIINQNKKNIINALENFSIITKKELELKLLSFKDGEDISWITIDKYHQLLKIAIFYMDYSPTQKMLNKFDYKHLSALCDLLNELFNNLHKNSTIVISKKRKLGFSGLTMGDYKLPYGLSLIDDFKDNEKRILDLNFLNKIIEKKYLTQREEIIRSKKGVRQYISNYNSKVFDTIRDEKLNNLEKMVMTNTNSGNSFNMKEMALKSEQNSLNEMIFKTNVVQEEAKLKGFDFLFITLTLPPKYHAVNKKHKFNTKKGHDDLNSYWSDVLRYVGKGSKKLKSGIDYYYITVNESHKDGCEHRHIMFFCKKEYHNKIIEICNRVYAKKFYPKMKLQTKIKEMLEIAIRYVIEDKTKASPATYLIKYILKEVDGDKTKFNDVKKWARLNSIRQFNIAGLNDINFQAYKAMQKVFNSENTLLNIDKILEESINVSKKSLMKITGILSSKISNYEKLKIISEYDAEIVYSKSLNKYEEEVIKPNGFTMFIDDEQIYIKTNSVYKIEEDLRSDFEKAMNEIGIVR